MSWIRDLVVGGGSTDIIIKAAPKPVAPKAKNLTPEESSYANIVGLADSSGMIHPGTLGVDYYTLMAMSRVPVIGAVIQTRIQQIAEFCMPQPSRYQSGYRIALRDREKAITPAGKRKVREIEEMLGAAGGTYGLGSFEMNVRALMRDSLIYDQANFEVLRTVGGGVAGWIPVDAATIRRVKPTDKDLQDGRYDLKPNKAFLQIIEDKTVAEYGIDEMSWGIRRPRTWIAANGYGYPELEELVRVITDLSNATTYNSVNFTNGIHASTILMLKSSMTAETFTAFKRHITAMMTGVRNAKRMPIIQMSPDNNEDIRAVPLGQSNQSMEFDKWINWLMKIACAVYSLDPAELGFIYGNEGQAQSLTNASPEARISASKERGLRPCLRGLQSWLNKWVIHPYDEDFTLDFVGIDAMSESERVELDSKSIRTFKTINEVRKEHDLDEIDSDIANMILDPSYIQAAQQAQMAEQGGGEEGEEGEEGGYEDFGGFEGGGGGFDLDAATQSMAMSTEAKLADGSAVWKGPRTGRSRLAYSDRGKCRAFIVEVD